MGDVDATVVLPTPGRKRSPFAPALERPAAAADLARLGGLNPLLEAANPLLAAVAQIRHALRHPDPAGLRSRLREQLRDFERRAREADIPDERVRVASFALSALLDDAASATPWGRDWPASGGEKFFSELERLSAVAPLNGDLLEFFYVCLALGFEGKYRGGGEGGRTALAQARAKLSGILAQQRPQGSSELSGRWQGAATPVRRIPGAAALWAAGAGCVLALAAIYLGYTVSLGALSDPVARQLAQLKPPALAGRAATAAAPEAPSALARQLAAGIGRGEVAVSDVAGGILIVLRSDELFGSGSARLDAALHPAILRVAAALDAVPGAIVVTGHTDDLPIRRARFPSNWELSTERARSVVELIGTRLREKGRLRAEGVADSEPVAPNDSAANRARNRRVEILLRSAS